MEEKIKEYVEKGGKLFTISNIDTIRDGGTKMIVCTNSDTFYINKDTKKFHLSYPITDENQLNDKLLNFYMLDRIKSYVEKLGDEFRRNKNLLIELEEVL